MNPQSSAAIGRKRRVFLVDDHPLVREGLANLINGQNDIVVCGEAEDSAQAMAGISEMRPDVALIDISLKNESGLELIKNLESQFPLVALIVLSMHDEALYAERALRAGARGYVMKKEPSEKIFEAIAHVLRGDIYVSERMKREMLESSVSGKRPGTEGGSILDRLTDRELQVFQLLGNGISTKEIAQRLNLSVKTIETYRENLKVKLNLRTGAELVQRAIQWSKSHPD